MLRVRSADISRRVARACASAVMGMRRRRSRTARGRPTVDRSAQRDHLAHTGKDPMQKPFSPRLIDFPSFRLSPCSPCAIGSYSVAAGAQSCSMCPSGKTTRSAGATSSSRCVAFCSPGEYGPQGLEPCSSCAIGSYANSTGASACSVCPSGFSTALSGQASGSSCKALCPAGKRSATTNGLPPCLSCPVGTYSSGLGSTSCTSCPIGTTTINSEEQSISACIKICDAGSRGDSGLSPCILCGIGTYQPSPMSSTCLVSLSFIFLSKGT